MTEDKRDEAEQANPEDVASLYSWANLEGVQYHDFSGSRDEMRARNRELTEQETAASNAVEDATLDKAGRSSGEERAPEARSSSEGSSGPGAPDSDPRSDSSIDRPDWLRGNPVRSASEAAPPAEALQQSRERVASRWFALKGVFEHAAEDGGAPLNSGEEIRVPYLGVFSLAGGVGKTSLVATLGRALSEYGERVLLVDAASYGLLPFYFGARELRPGTVRIFSPPGGSTDAPIHMVSVEREGFFTGSSVQAEDDLVADLRHFGRGSNRVLVDLATGSGPLLRRFLRLMPTLLVPVAPDMNSVVSLSMLDIFFRSHADTDAEPVKPYFLLSQFDASLPLHLDVREVLREQLGDRLLPFVLRRSATVSEALAEGMTVVDYAPNSPVTEDFMALATWIRSIAAPAAAGFRGVRWSER